MKVLTDNQKKIDLIARLVKDGHIDFTEAITLMEEKTEYVYTPSHFPLKDNTLRWPYRVTDIMYGMPGSTSAGSTLQSGRSGNSFTVQYDSSVPVTLTTSSILIKN